jgi:amino acid adenylation domain-containing protein
MTHLVESRDTLFTWFRESARAHPDVPAIDMRGAAVSYRELLDIVERLAARVAAAAGGPPRQVGLLVSRSLAGYAGYLAALRLGAVVVPLNPAFPPARNRTICHATGVEVIVVDDDGMPAAGDVLAGTGWTAVVLESGAGGHKAGRELGERCGFGLATPCWLDGLPDEPWSGAYQGVPDGVAYVLFTSGSTGEPKGVPIRHRNVCPCIAYSVDRYGVGPGCRVSHVFDLTSDPSVIDMFMALSAGATLVVLDGDDLLTPARSVAEKGITHWNSVPSLISIARRLRTLPPGSMPGLRWAVFGGEQLRFEQVEVWAAAAPNCTIENVYGPTELAINCALYRIPTDRRHWPRTPNGTVPIGRIHPHLRAVILGEDGAESDEGELCVQGPQRFDGYLDPDRNPGRFVRYDGRNATVPCEGSPPADAWYRTGDRVWRDATGVMVHLGRLDDQVKIGGFRIELGEIESVLCSHPRVREAVVVAVRRDGGESRLAAAYTGDVADHGELAGFVQDRLPNFMVPRRYHHLAEIPVTASGKTDRRRLATQLATRTSAD